MWLAQALEGLGISVADSLLVAFSGGRDSAALLHALSRLGRPELRAVHVNHGLAAGADAWAAQALATAGTLGVACEAVSVHVGRGGSAGPEAHAREARYRALASLMRAGEVLLTAHHASDQAETVLFRLVRGAGLAGLGGMTGVRPFGPGRLARPLLDLPGAALAAYVAEWQVPYVHDPSNDDERYTRNYIRHRLLPVISARWPRGIEAINRAAGHAREAHDLLAAYVARDVEACTAVDGALMVPAFLALQAEIRAQVLRAWLAGRGGPAVSEAKCAEILAALAVVPRSRGQVLRLGRAAVLRRYRDRMVFGRDEAGGQAPALRCVWAAPFTDLDLGDGRCLRAVPVFGEGAAVARIGTRSLVAATRVLGQRVLIPGRGHRALKKLLQELGIAPWDRSRAILIFVDDALIAVADHWICQDFRAGPYEAGLAFHVVP